jgi:hypothetical protein
MGVAHAPLTLIESWFVWSRLSSGRGLDWDCAWASSTTASSAGLRDVGARWVKWALGLAAAFAVLVWSLLDDTREDHAIGTTAHVETFLALACAAVVAVSVGICAAIWRSVRRTIGDALDDRHGERAALEATVRRVIPAPSGGRPILLKTADHHAIWLTAGERALAPLRRAWSASAAPPAPIDVTLTYHVRSRVVDDVSGVTVGVPAASTPAPGSRRSAATACSALRGARMECG